MTDPKITILVRRGLEGAERIAAMELVELCNRHEGLDLPAMLDAEGATQLLCTAGDELAGIATLQDGSDGVETLAVVRPARRRQGIGRALLDAARAQCRARGHDALLLVCETASASGRGFVAALGAAPRHSEHRMELDPAAVDRSRPRPRGYQLRAAGPADQELLEMLQAESFGDTPDEARQYIAAGLADPTRQYFVGEADSVPIGMLRLGRYQDVADITAFGVLPGMRGRGYGRAMLLDAADTLLDERWERILIEVFTDNDRALGLYESCGFRVTSTYMFFTLAT